MCGPLKKSQTLGTVPKARPYHRQKTDKLNVVKIGQKFVRPVVENSKSVDARLKAVDQF